MSLPPPEPPPSEAAPSRETAAPGEIKIVEQVSNLLESGKLETCPTTSDGLSVVDLPDELLPGPAEEKWVALPGDAGMEIEHLARAALGDLVPPEPPLDFNLLDDADLSLVPGPLSLAPGPSSLAADDQEQGAKDEAPPLAADAQGQRTKDQKPRTRDKGQETKDKGPRTKDKIGPILLALVPLLLLGVLIYFGMRWWSKPRLVKLPAELDKRAYLWAESWLKYDTQSMVRMSHPDCRGLTRWWVHEHRPPMPPGKFDRRKAAIDVRFLHRDESSAEAEVRVSLSGAAKPIVWRQQWECLNGTWVFKPADEAVPARPPKPTSYQTPHANSP